MTAVLQFSGTKYLLATLVMSASFTLSVRSLNSLMVCLFLPFNSAKNACFASPDGEFGLSSEEITPNTDSSIIDLVGVCVLIQSIELSKSSSVSFILGSRYEKNLNAPESISCDAPPP